MPESMGNRDMGRPAAGEPSNPPGFFTPARGVSAGGRWCLVVLRLRPMPLAEEVGVVAVDVRGRRAGGRKCAVVEGRENERRLPSLLVAGGLV